MPKTVAVVGAGIVGLSVAVQLQRDGFHVTVFDRSTPMQACSAGNAGYISEANIFPPATRDILWRMPSLLFSRQSPLVVKPSYAPQMARWGRKSMSTLKADKSRTVTTLLAGMTVKAYDTLHDLATVANARELLTREGGLVVFKHRRTLEKKVASIPQWKQHGLMAERVDAAQVKALEPCLSADIVGGIYFPNSGRCANPQRLGLLYASHLQAGGGRIAQEAIFAVSPNADQSVTIAGAEGEKTFDHVVVCCGFWSASLLSRYYRDIPLASERGYHLMLPDSGVSLNRPVVFGEPHFAATPMEHGLRLAGTAEFAHADAPANMRRAFMLLKLARRYLGAVGDEAATPWMGIRPSLPDGLPAIGKVSANINLYYAFGHGHNGLTLSALTAKSIAALVQGNRSPVPLAPLGLERFF